MDDSSEIYFAAGDTFYSNTNSMPTACGSDISTKKPLLCEPKKPVSAYALFFKDTVSAIKSQRPDVTYTEICAIVASMWEALDEEHKNVYHNKCENAKKEYILQMSVWRQQQQQQQNDSPNETPILISTTTSPRQQLTKPAVFTIARTSAAPIPTNQIQSPQLNIVSTDLTQSTLSSSSSVFQPQQPSPTQIDTTAINTNTMSAVTNNYNNNVSDISQNQNQFSNDSNNFMTQKCFREGCTKRAIINPDWEDEYCSNECVILHCRNVFNAWVQSNLESRAG